MSASRRLSGHRGTPLEPHKSYYRRNFVTLFLIGQRVAVLWTQDCQPSSRTRSPAANSRPHLYLSAITTLTLARRRVLVHALPRYGRGQAGLLPIASRLRSVDPALRESLVRNRPPCIPIDINTDHARKIRSLVPRKAARMSYCSKR